MKNDQYRKNRGGWSRILQISCEKCGRLICKYQKDGPGPLKRMYIDRIIGREQGGSKFVCPDCGTILGTKILYEKEARPAYRLFQDSVKKRIVKL